MTNGLRVELNPTWAVAPDFLPGTWSRICVRKYSAFTVCRSLDLDGWAHSKYAVASTSNGGPTAEGH